MPTSSFERPAPSVAHITDSDRYTTALGTGPTPALTPAIKVSFPTSMSLSIPFFSRSSSSTTSTSSGSYAYSCSYSTSTDIEDHDLSPLSTSFPRLSLASGAGQAQGHGQGHVKYEYGHSHRSYDHMQTSPSRSSLGSNASSIRPALKKMPSWSSWNIGMGLEGSRSSSIDQAVPGPIIVSGHENENTSSDGEDVSMIGRLSFSESDDRKGSISGRFHLDIGTWGKSPRIFLTSTNKKNKAKQASEKHASVSLPSKRIKLRSPSVIHKIPQVISPENLPPLQRVWARTEEPSVPDINGLDRERRGSDWPPTQGRDMNLDLTGIKTLADEIVEDDDSPQEGLIGPSCAMNVEDGDDDDTDRVDTPMDMPSMPRLDLTTRPSILSPVLDGEEEQEEEEEEEATIEEAEAKARSGGNENDEEFFTPSPMPASLFSRTPYPSRMEAPGEAPTFDLSIFSPRPPPPPVLRGILENLPVSPLELPTLRNSNTFPTPVLPRDPPTSPLHMPAPRRGVPGESIESVLHPSLSRRSSIIGNDRPRRPSIPGLPRRRMSLSIRPAILPCPTPPSLLTSPKTLGSEYIPPLFSPSSITPVSSRFLYGAGSSSLPRRRGRGSMRLKLPPSYFSEAGTGPGLVIEQDQNDQNEMAKEQEEHVATPGTFGLEGERERLEAEGVNPYFA
ncbi:hypothetical protein IAU59_000182 [Kwoniella sp. CBS 9459]